LLLPYLHFVDDLLIDFFNYVQQYFPTLSAEVRVDFHPYMSADGIINFHVHSKTFKLPGVDVVGSYYGPYMEAENKGEQLTTDQAFEHFLRAQYRVLSQLRDVKVFIDQFLFSMAESEFAHFAWMDEATQEEFIDRAGAWMRMNAAGYAIWSYTDYIIDQLSNGAFRLGLDRWHHAGSVSVSADGETGCRIGSDGKVWQLLPQRLDGGVVGLEVVIAGDVEFDVRHAENATVRVSLRRASGERHKLLLRFSGEALFISLELVRGDLLVKKVAAGPEVVSHGGYSLDFQQRGTCRRLIALNKLLA
jgi:hypothetical protein